MDWRTTAGFATQRHTDLRLHLLYLRWCCWCNALRWKLNICLQFLIKKVCICCLYCHLSAAVFQETNSFNIPPRPSACFPLITRPHCLSDNRLIISLLQIHCSSLDIQTYTKVMARRWQTGVLISLMDVTPFNQWPWDCASSGWWIMGWMAQHRKWLKKIKKNAICICKLIYNECTVCAARRSLGWWFGADQTVYNDCRCECECEWLVVFLFCCNSGVFHLISLKSIFQFNNLILSY